MPIAEKQDFSACYVLRAGARSKTRSRSLLPVLRIKSGSSEARKNQLMLPSGSAAARRFIKPGIRDKRFLRIYAGPGWNDSVNAIQHLRR